VSLEVDGNAETAVLVTPKGKRSIGLDGRTGDAAAHLVAMMAQDLVLSDLSHGPGAAPSAAVTELQVGSRSPAASRGTELDLELAGTAAIWSGVLAGAELEATWLRAGWLASVDLGGGALFGGDLALRDATFGLGAGRRLGPIDLELASKLAWLDVHEGAGDSTTLVGATGSARLRVPVASSHLVVAVGLDVFATRTLYQTAPARVIATPWVAPWLATGLEVRL
jgi:hypothetical protein